MKQLLLFESDVLYKVRWKAFAEIWGNDPRQLGYYKIFLGYSDEVIIKTTAAMMSKERAESFIRFIVEDCNEYAGWHELIKCVNDDTN